MSDHLALRLLVSGDTYSEVYMRTLNILDVSNFIYVYHYKNIEANRGVREEDGYFMANSAPIGGVVGLMQAIKKYITMDEDILLCFDRKPEYNKRLYQSIYGEDGYKSQRPASRERIFVQKDFAERLCQHLHLPICAVEEMEADDCIYSAWKYYRSDYDHIRIRTNDSDLAFMVDSITDIQHVGKGDAILNKDNYAITLRKDVYMDYNTILLHKFLFGDTADHIKGMDKAWWGVFPPYLEEHNISMEELGDLNVCRQVIAGVVAEQPSLPMAPYALDIFNLLAPKLVPRSEIDLPGKTVDMDALDYIINLKTKGNDRWGIEDLLSDYLTEYHR